MQIFPNRIEHNRSTRSLSSLGVFFFRPSSLIRFPELVTMVPAITVTTRRSSCIILATIIIASISCCTTTAFVSPLGHRSMRAVPLPRRALPRIYDSNKNQEPPKLPGDDEGDDEDTAPTKSTDMSEESGSSARSFYEEFEFDVPAYMLSIVTTAVYILITGSYMDPLTPKMHLTFFAMSVLEIFFMAWYRQQSSA